MELKNIYKIKNDGKIALILLCRKKKLLKFRLYNSARCIFESKIHVCFIYIFLKTKQNKK